MKGLLIKYPSNYDPDTRVYAGTWDGTFVTGWTDNPAWIFYDLVLNTRYGLGAKVDATMIDRFSLYQIAQYCDVMVSDGKGGLEPRFTCNCYIQSRTDAYKVLQDLASVFRGMAYWAAGAVVATSDMPTDPVYVYTAANVIDGQFKYVGSSLKTRYTVALVTWNDPENAYKSAVEYVEDADGVARYGINKAEITAFGCTSRTQAQRVGNWSILTSRLETNGVTFSVGLDGTLAQPGQIIAVADPARAGRRLGGRVHAVSGTNQVTVDKLMAQAAIGDTFTVVSPSGVAESSTISGISGNVVNVNPPLAAPPVVGSVYMIESATVESQLFRVNSVAEKDGITFEINALQYEPSKYAAIDSGASVDVRPTTGIPLNTQAPPTGVAVSQYVVTDQGIAKTNMTISWLAAPAAVAYVVQWRKDSGDWVDGGRTGGTSLDVHNIYQGSYVARVRAINSLDVSSVYAISSETALAGKTGAPPLVSTLTASTDQIFAIRLNWSFPASASDTAYTEIYSSHTNDFTTATQLGRYSYPTSTTNLIGLVAGFDMYFWARLVDTSGNIGSFFPASTGAGVHGMSTMDATAILGYLTGQITVTQLSSDLQQTISLFSPEMAGSAVAFAGDNTLFAGVWSEQDARITGDLATATKLDQVQAVAGNASAVAAASFSASASLSGQLSASYTIKTQITQDGRTYIAGIGVGIDNSSGVVESQVLVAADRFGVIQEIGGTAFVPFVIQDGTAFINSAFIGTASITTAKIADATITTAKIADANITNAKIADASITTAKIVDAQITNAKIGNAAIGTANIQNGAITNAQIGTATITTANIGTAQIDTARIGANAVTTSASFSFGSTPGSQNYVGRGGTAIVLAAGAPGQVGLVQFVVNGVTLSSTGGATAFATITMANGNNTVSNTQAGTVSILEAVR
jgi:predicted phage tail protein